MINHFGIIKSLASLKCQSCSSSDKSVISSSIIHISAKFSSSSPSISCHNISRIISTGQQAVNEPQLCHILFVLGNHFFSLFRKELVLVSIKFIFPNLKAIKIGIDQECLEGF